MPNANERNEFFLDLVAFLSRFYFSCLNFVFMCCHYHALIWATKADILPFISEKVLYDSSFKIDGLAYTGVKAIFDYPIFG